MDEAAITSSAWLPGAGWADITPQVLLSAGATVEHGGIGKTITFTVADESRLQFRDDLAVAVVARHWFPASFAYGGWYLVGWGFLDGSGRSRLGLGLDQTSERFVTYHGYWGLSRVPSLRLGRRNLATGATIAAASPHLLDPDAEIVNGEYLSQDDCSPQKILDGTVDSVAVADAIADPEVPTIGQTQVPKFLRVYGPHTRGVAAGGEPRFVELWAGHNLIPWGSFDNAAAVPLRENDDPVEQNNEYQHAYIEAGKFIMHAKRQAQNQNNSVFVGWNIGSAYHGAAGLVRFRVKAGATESIGKNLQVQLGTDGPQPDLFVRLTQIWQQFDIPLDLAGAGQSVKAGGLNIKFRAFRDDLFLSDVWFEIEDLELWVGYEGDKYTKEQGRALFLGLDDGAGHERLLRLANLNGGSEIRIPPRGSIIVCDDIATFKKRFGDTGQTLLQTKLDYPEWYFAPGVGRMKLVWGNDPQRLDYDDAQPTGPVINSAQQQPEEINFAVANGGVPWLPTQALSRQNPIGTGIMATEDYPETGLLPVPYTSAYWQIDLGEYDAPTLVAPLSDTGLRLTPSDIDAYTDHGYGTFVPGGERAWWTGKEGDSLVFADLSRRGIDGTTRTAHGAGDRFVPDSFGGVYQNTLTRQRGWNIDLIELRRKPGTTPILAGAVLISNQVAPGNPSEGGARWEKHPDWQLVQRFTERGGSNPDVVTMVLRDILGGPREARHVTIVVDRMQRVSNTPQRAKLNEVVILEAVLGGTQAGRWLSPQVGTVGDGIAHLLTRYANVPASKIQITVPTPSIRDLVISPSMVGQAVQTLASSAHLRVWLDAANNVIIDADPANPAYRATSPYFVAEIENLIGDVSLSWAAAHRVAQQRVAGREAGSMRQYSARYPRSPGRGVNTGLGEISEARDLLFRTSTDALATAIALFRRGNARRELGATMGALPWLEPYQRVLLNIPEIELGGGGAGLNTYVASFSVKLGIDAGGVTWDTSLSLKELAL